MIEVLDLFCGTGAFSKGLENAHPEYRTIFGVDVLPYAVDTFKANHIDATAWCQDIRKTTPVDVAEAIQRRRGEVSLIIGGPPCQGFSSIRPFRSYNYDDPRNTLFENFAMFVDYFRPKMFVMENVVGLATHNKGHTIEIMQDIFYQMGYETDWRILNAAHYGVPQKRERIIFIGSQKGQKIPFPNPTHSYYGSTIGYRDKNRMFISKQPNLFEDEFRLKTSISVMDAINDLPSISSGEEMNSYHQPPRNEYQSDRRKDCDTLTLHYSTRHSPKMLEIIKYSGKNINSIPSHLITSGFSSCYSRLDGNQPAVTITVNFVHPASNRCIHPISDRALTPREGPRLQSFDDDFIFKGNKTQIVKQIGNAVPPLLGKVIGEALVSSIR